MMVIDEEICMRCPIHIFWVSYRLNCGKLSSNMCDVILIEFRPALSRISFLFALFYQLIMLAPIVFVCLTYPPSPLFCQFSLRYLCVRIPSTRNACCFAHQSTTISSCILFFTHIMLICLTSIYPASMLSIFVFLSTLSTFMCMCLSADISVIRYFIHP